MVGYLKMTTQQRYARLNQRPIADVYRNYSTLNYADLCESADRFLERCLCAEYFGFNRPAWVLVFGRLARGFIHQPPPAVMQIQEAWWCADTGAADG